MELMFCPLQGAPILVAMPDAAFRNLRPGVDDESYRGRRKKEGKR